MCKTIKTKVTVERIGIVYGENRATLRVCQDAYLHDYLLPGTDHNGKKVAVGLFDKTIEPLKDMIHVKIENDENDRLFSYLFEAYKHEKEVVVYLEKRKNGMYVVVGLEFYS
ncbi:hypothetical protein [Ureibacillus thermophilus]|uniref:Uncharacterized protein n=1 Tax=Ureibacillus thermophilus TaxID=367743 RepID=A0A4P6UUI3_9BACL|nr:hypothetical protein [Ureibacillus thermophilus]QBK26913.1 hypothetical protein DKZ56_14350 [Ureibacillus thermophilus]